MPLVRFPTPAGLVYTIDLSKIADRENPRTVEAAINAKTDDIPFTVDWGDGTSTDFPAGASAYPTHEYAQGAGDVFTVVIRSATGKLPRVRFCEVASGTPSINLNYAVTSIDHFGGALGYNSLDTYNTICRMCGNLVYAAPILFGLTAYRDLYYALNGCRSLDMPISAFCVDFIAGDGDYTFASAFDGAAIYGEIPSDFFDRAADRIKRLTTCFSACSRLTGAPYVFWKEDGSLDTDKFPVLNNGTNCYVSCSAAIRAQVPTTYGGTMTVS